MLQTMLDKAEWMVRVPNWTWQYVFFKNGSVRWKNPLNGTHGSGTWKIEKDKMVTRWFASKTWEEWNLPINPQAASGICHMERGDYPLQAVANNIIVAEGVDILARIPQNAKEFLTRCGLAFHVLQQAELNFTVFLSSISIAYGRAFAAHDKLMSDIDATQRLAQDMLLGAALAFLGGPYAAVIAAVMQEVVGTVISEGVKDLAKFAIRGPGGEAIRSLADQTTVTAMPASPLEWQNFKTKVVTSRLAAVHKIILGWEAAVTNDSSSFQAGFDPVEIVHSDLFLVGKGGAKFTLADLPTIDDAKGTQLQIAYQKGFLVGWLPIGLQGITTIPGARGVVFGKINSYGTGLGFSEIKDPFFDPRAVDPMPR